jgi:hypothetical protein
MSPQNRPVSPVDEYFSTQPYTCENQAENPSIAPNSIKVKHGGSTITTERAGIQPSSASERSRISSTLPSKRTQLSTDDAPPHRRHNERAYVDAAPAFVESGETQAFLPNKHPASTSTNEEETEGKDSRKALLMTWWVEITFLMVAIAALVAIVVTMAEHDRKEQPAWRYTINLNTLIAILSTLLRACMVFVVEEGKMHYALRLC